MAEDNMYVQVQFSKTKGDKKRFSVLQAKLTQYILPF